jgi:cytochrome c biogenesis protein CcmG/thiol:disulfide interchange protein DsbE
MKKAFTFILLCIVLVFAQKDEHAKAPDFSLEDVNGHTVCLDSLLTTGPVFMSFWALWCKMCIKELDALKPYFNEFDSLGIHLLAISVDKARSVPQVKPFALSHKWKYTVVLDPDDALRGLYQVQAMPSSFIITQDKEIIFTHMGYKPGDEDIIIETMRNLFEEDGDDASKE